MCFSRRFLTAAANAPRCQALANVTANLFQGRPPKLSYVLFLGLDYVSKGFPDRLLPERDHLPDIDIFPTSFSTFEQNSSHHAAASRLSPCNRFYDACRSWKAEEYSVPLLTAVGPGNI